MPVPYDIFILQNQQEEIEILSKELKRITSNKKFTLCNVPNLYFNKTSDLSLTLASLDSWDKSNEYRKKFYSYKRLLKNYYTDDFSSSLYPLNNYTAHRIELLQNLIILSENLSINYNEAEGLILRNLEFEFYCTAKSEEYYSILDWEIFPLEEKSNLQKYTAYIKSRLYQLKRIFYFKIKRDLRNQFRKLMSFYFKNMDDESNIANLSSKERLTIRLLNHLNIFLWKAKLKLNF